jgi:hypothetical protein
MEKLIKDDSRKLTSLEEIRLVNQLIASILERLWAGEKMTPRDLDAFSAEVDTTAQMVGQMEEMVEQEG